jgi:hypothetical protein
MGRQQAVLGLTFFVPIRIRMASGEVLPRSSICLDVLQGAFRYFGTLLHHALQFIFQALEIYGQVLQGLSSGKASVPEEPEKQMSSTDIEVTAAA